MGKNLNLLFSSCVIVDDKLFCVTDIGHIFIKINLNSGEVIYIDDPIGYLPNEWSGTDRIIKNSNNIFLLEENGERIIRYTPFKNSCQYMDIKCNDYICSNFVGVAIYENNMYIFPRFRDGVIKIDLLSNIVRYGEKLCPDINYVFDEKEKIHRSMFSCCFQIKNHMWVFTERDNIVIDYDLSTEKSERYFLPRIIKSCVRVDNKGKVFFILTLEGKVYSWNYENDEVLELYENDTKKVYPYFWQIIVTGNKLWILPCFGKDIVVVNLLTKRSKIYKNYPIDFEYYSSEECSKYNNYCEDEKKYYFAMHSGNYILSIDKENGREYWIKPEVNLKIKAAYCLKHSMYNIESSFYNIINVLNLLKVACEFNREERVYENMGNRIWNMMNKLA